jgi:hypothetical protein
MALGTGVLGVGGLGSGAGPGGITEGTGSASGLLFICETQHPLRRVLVKDQVLGGG